MQLINRFFSLLLTFLLSFFSIGDSTVGYTGGEPIQAARHEYCFDNSGLLIGAYYADHDRVALAKEAGIQFFVESSIDEAFLDDCYANGIGVIGAGYNFPAGYGHMDDNFTNIWTGADPSAYRDHPALWGDDLIDEPDAQSFENISECVESYRENHPDKLPYVNLFPSYADNEQLGCDGIEISADGKLITNELEKGTDRYKEHVSEYINTIDTDYISVDIYPYASSLDRKGNEVKSTSDCWLKNLDILAVACRDTGRDLWVITQACGLTENGTEGGDKRYCDDPEDISQQAYASLAFGAKAIIHAEFAAKGWWDPESHMIGPDGEPTKTYYAVKEVDGYLAAFAQVYGDYKYAGTYYMNSARVAGAKGYILEADAVERSGNINSFNGLLVGVFDKTGGDGTGYIVCNMEELNNSVTASAYYTVKPGETITVYQKGETKTFKGGSTTKLTLEPGEGVFITSTANN